MGEWTDWRPFPDPRRGELLVAPLGAGVYQLRRRDTLELILFGIGGHVTARMASLLPEPLGCRGRNNTAKRSYLLEHLPKVEYRTMPCSSRAEAAVVERSLPRHLYRYPT